MKVNPDAMQYVPREHDLIKYHTGRRQDVMALVLKVITTRGYRNDPDLHSHRVDVLTDAGDIDKWVLYSDIHHTIELIQRSHRN